MGRYVEQRLIANEERSSGKGAGLSPLKWLFSIIILVDGTSILINSYG